MRFFIVLGLLVGIGWLAFGRAFDAFHLKSAKDLTGVKGPAGVAMAVPAKPLPVAGGSFATSMRDSVVMAPPSKPLLPTVSRVVHFDHRRMPSQDFFAAYTAQGLQIVPDLSARSCFLRGPLDLVTDVSDMLQSSDKVPGSCSLRGWVVWVADGDADGWEFSAALGATVDNGVKAVLTGSELVLDASIGEVSAAIRVLDDTARVRVVQEPHVRLSDGTEARIESLDEVPIPETTLSNGIATQSITYKKVGLELAVMPTFLTADRVRLNVTQTGGAVGRSVRIDQSEIPVIQTQRVSSELDLAVGQSVVLGGVRSSRTSEKKGWLHNVTEVESGVLYVVLALYDETPKARVVEPDWISDLDSMVLPPKGALGAAN